MSRPWMPLYVADYLADTSHLRIAQSGAYLHLIMHYWQKGSLPTDDAMLASIVRMTEKEWKAVKPAIQPFFQDGWKHPRIESELVKSDAAYERRAQAGKKGGEAKAIGKQPPSNARATKPPLPKQSLSQSQEEAAASSSQAADAHSELRAECERATGWHGLEGIGVIAELIAEGFDMDDRILPVMRDIAADLKKFGHPQPDKWAYCVKAIRDPSRQVKAANKKVSGVFVPLGSDAWHEMLKTKSESFLRSTLTKQEGIEGVWNYGAH